MREFARRLMALEQYQDKSEAQPTAIFGDAGQLMQHLDLDRPAIRIGLWPIISTADPELAMGVAAVLAYLLEGWRDVRVYRLFVKLEDQSKQFDWTMQHSQFGVDDWQIDELDENVAVWGALHQTENGWGLDITVEGDEIEGEEKSRRFNYAAENVAALIYLLPGLAKEIAEFIEASEHRETYPEYHLSTSPDETLKPLLSLLFSWERRLMLALWGEESSPLEDLEKAHEALISAAKTIDNDAVENTFGMWCAACATARGMLPGFDAVSRQLIARVDDVVNAFPNRAIPYLLLAPALYKAGNPEDGFDLLETAVEQLPEESNLWLLLASLYWQGARYLDAIDVHQRAIEEGQPTASLYMNYAANLTALFNAGEELEEFILIDPDDYDSDRTAWEAAEAYEEALELDENNARALHNQLLLFATVLDDEDRLWDGFEELVEIDDTGEQVRSLVDTLYTIEDLSEPIGILEHAIENAPERADLRVDLAILHIYQEAYEEARKVLEEARQHTDDPELLADIQRQLLIVDIPDFESQMREISDILGAGNNISSHQLEFLEDVVERAPKFAEAYLLLAKAYLEWEQADAALETLLDAQKQVPDDPDILELLARVLWDADEPQLAFDYLKRGLALYPNHVPLLARAGLYLFEYNELKNARGYLARAEAISPRHPALSRARVEIARMIAKDEAASEEE